MASHLASLWKWGFLELGNGLLEVVGSAHEMFGVWTGSKNSIIVCFTRIELSSLFKDIFLKYGFFFVFSLSLVDVNATVFLDYLPIAPSQFPKSLVFPGGVTSVTEILTFEIINDAAHEEDEVFKLELSLDGTSQSTATIGNQDTLIVVIKDDDPIEL